MGPLSGLKVVDLTHVMAGPTCEWMLPDMGAEVIKIEKIPAGDDTRYMVPPRIGDEAASFLMMNRNKRGIAVDRKTAVCAILGGETRGRNTGPGEWGNPRSGRGEGSRRCPWAARMPQGARRPAVI